MMTLEEIVSHLEGRNLKIVAKEADVNYQTLRRISLGQNSTYTTLEKVGSYLEVLLKIEKLKEKELDKWRTSQNQ